VRLEGLCQLKNPMTCLSSQTFPDILVNVFYHLHEGLPHKEYQVTSGPFRSLILKLVPLKSLLCDGLDILV
jgi:hypothetical protein